MFPSSNQSLPPHLHRTRSQLEQLASLQSTWREFQTARAELSAALEGDRLKLGLLREALLTGGDVGSRVQDVARVLTERSSRAAETAPGHDGEVDADAAEDRVSHLVCVIRVWLASCESSDIISQMKMIDGQFKLSHTRFH